jgi:hypothetical protein
MTLSFDRQLPAVHGELFQCLIAQEPWRNPAALAILNGKSWRPARAYCAAKSARASGRRPQEAPERRAKTTSKTRSITLLECTRIRRASLYSNNHEDGPSIKRPKFRL